MMGATYLIAVFTDHGTQYNGNFCGDCVRDICTPVGKRKLDNTLARSGWVQPPLPEVQSVDRA
jgi:hypothetical protein